MNGKKRKTVEGESEEERSSGGNSTHWFNTTRGVIKLPLALELDTFGKSSMRSLAEGMLVNNCNL